MEEKEKDLAVNYLMIGEIPKYPVLFMKSKGKEVIFFQIGDDCDMTVTKEGKVTIRGMDGESEATPAIYYALRKFLGVPEE
jgi:hypothetical protein